MQDIMNDNPDLMNQFMGAAMKGMTNNMMNNNNNANNANASVSINLSKTTVPNTKLLDKEHSLLII